MSNATDNFNRPNQSGPGGNWAGDTGYFSIASDALEITSNPSDQRMIYYNAAFNANHFSEVTFGTVANVSMNGPAVCVQPGGKCYRWVYYSTEGYLQLISGNADAATLGTVAGLTANTGDVWHLDISGSTLTCKINGVTKLTETDSTLTGGYPGIAIIGAVNNGGDTYTLWTGGPLTAYAHAYTDAFFGL